MLRVLMLSIALLMGAGAVANGMFMLVDPGNWYVAIPGVTTTGPFNQHFIRDIGMMFALVGLLYMYGAWRPAVRLLTWAMATIWVACHATFHFWEIAVGICGPEKFLIDFPGVFLPAFVGVAMTSWAFATRDR